MAVNFPSPAVDKQLYPDIANGDSPLENGRVYIYDAAAKVWNLHIKPSSSLDDYVLKAGDDMTGRLLIEKPQQDNATNSFIIKGRVKDSNGDLGDPDNLQILLKDYRRESASTQSDYIAYYGSNGGDYEVVNRQSMEKYALHRYGDKIEDATSNCNYSWNKNVDISSEQNFSLASGNGKPLSIYPSGECRVYVKDNSADDVKGFTVIKGLNDSLFTVRAGGVVEAGKDAANAFVATEDHHVATKKYALNKLGETVDATEKVEYKWNQNVTIESSSTLYLNAGTIKPTANVFKIVSGLNNTSSAFYVQTYDGKDDFDRDVYKTKFRVRGNGKVQAGDVASEAFMASEPHDLITKKYFDANAGSSLVDVRTNNPSNADIGHMWYNKSTNQLLLRIS